jgi:hypothetical protein
VRLICLGVLLLAACNVSANDAGGDPDTDSPSARRTPTATGSLTFGVPANGGQFSDPQYLPDWAPQYPGSKVMSKTVQRDEKGIVGRVTEFATHDPFGKVVDFYAEALKRSGRTPILATRDTHSAGFSLERVGAVHNHIIITETTGGTPPKVLITIGASTDR